MGKRGVHRDQRLQFEQCAMPHLDALYTSALRLVRNSDDAKDLLQETILRAYRCFHKRYDMRENTKAIVRLFETATILTPGLSVSKES